MSLGGHVALVKASALYLGSAVPLETAMGLEAFQMPCRERYWSALDSSMKVDGIDASIIMYSSGLLMQVDAFICGLRRMFHLQVAEFINDPNVIVKYIGGL
jgi:hypothetical protein